MSSTNNIGLKARLLKAATPDELDALMDEGTKFQHATEKTRRQWRRNANNRYNFLTTTPKTPAKKDRKGKETVAA